MGIERFGQRTGRENTRVYYCPTCLEINEPVEAGAVRSAHCDRGHALNFVSYEAGVEEAVIERMFAPMIAAREGFIHPPARFRESPFQSHVRHHAAVAALGSPGLTAMVEGWKPQD